MARPTESDTTTRTRALQRLHGALDVAEAVLGAAELERLAADVELAVGLRHVPREPSLSEVLAGAERASERVAAWPEWKRRVA